MKLSKLILLIGAALAVTAHAQSSVERLCSAENADKTLRAIGQRLGPNLNSPKSITLDLENLVRRIQSETLTENSLAELKAGSRFFSTAEQGMIQANQLIAADLKSSKSQVAAEAVRASGEFTRTQLWYGRLMTELVIEEALLQRSKIATPSDFHLNQLKADGNRLVVSFQKAQLDLAVAKANLKAGTAEDQKAYAELSKKLDDTVDIQMCLLGSKNFPAEFAAVAGSVQ